MNLFRLFKRRRDDPRLHGRWRVVRAEDPALEIGRGVEMTFSPDGTLTYSIEQADRWQIINLVYTVQGDEIVSDQPSAPAPHRTRYAFDAQGHLILTSDGARTWCTRAPTAPQ
jgi:hypothetical protein